MVYSANGMAIQVFPISSNTFIGVPTNQECAGKVVHLNAEGAITFHFETGDKVLPIQPAGMDFIAEKDCTGVTSTVSVLIG